MTLPKELTGIIYSYLNWCTDQRYLLIIKGTREYTYVKNIWKKNTLFEVKNSDISFKINLVEYFVNGVRHKDDDLPAIDYSDGDKLWYNNGKRHRKGKPAVIYGKYKAWYKHGVYDHSYGTPWTAEPKSIASPFCSY